MSLPEDIIELIVEFSCGKCSICGFALGFAGLHWCLKCGEVHCAFCTWLLSNAVIPVVFPFRAPANSAHAVHDDVSRGMPGSMASILDQYDDSDEGD